MAKILFVYMEGRRSRLLESRAGREAPMEFLFGLTYLEARGYEVDVLELTDLSPDRNSAAHENLLRENVRLQQATGFTSTSHHFDGSLDILNRYDGIIAGGDGLGIGISHFIRKGTVKPPMFVVTTGMLLHTQLQVRPSPLMARVRDIARSLYYRFVFGRNRKRRRVYGDLLDASSGTLYFERSEYEMAQRMFPEYANRMHLSIQCIDTNFWRPNLATNRDGSSPDYILFIGNDRGRDFELVQKIARHLSHLHFVFVTNRIRSEEVPSNVTLKQGDWKANLISDVEIRRIIQDSSVVVLPFKSGDLHTLTSVALQAMACGKPVMVSKTSGLWEPEFIDRQHIWFIHSGSLSEWCEDIEVLMRDSLNRERIGELARRLVEGQNNLTVLGSNLEAIIKQ